MAGKNRQEIILTPSGHQADKDLAKVPIKVSPSLQALIANQVELIEMIEGKVSRDPVFIEQHKMEMIQVEEEIAGAFSSYMAKREKARARRQLKKELSKKAVFDGGIDGINEPVTEGSDTPAKPVEFNEGASGHDFFPVEEDGLRDKTPVVPEINYDTPAEKRELETMPAGLPSSKYERRSVSAEAGKKLDVRRIALGASIKALQSFLGRELTEEEMQSLEAQVDLYLK